MFDDAQEPKDMFADVPEAAPRSVSSMPQPTVAAAPQPMASQTITPAQAVQYADVPRSGGAAVRLVGIVLVSLMCIGGAGYAAYRFMIKDAVTQQVTQVIGNTTPETTGTTTPTETDGKASTTPSTPSPAGTDTGTDAGPTAVVDSDGDGLSNDEERIAGTSVAKPDTDGDGLGDREEVKVYETDPKKTDTDGDGYGDGDEVKNGYNPNGAGKLLQLPE